MGLFDNFGSKLTNVSNQVSSKAKDGAEQLKLNNEISNLRSQILQHYQHIGSMYYAQMRSGAAAGDYEAEFTAIDQLNAQIADKQARISDIKAQITCPSCGISVAPDSAFCPNCGAPMMQPAQTAPVQRPVTPPVAPAAAPVNPTVAPAAAPTVQPVVTPVTPVETPAVEPVATPVAPVASPAESFVVEPAADPVAPTDSVVTPAEAPAAEVEEPVAAPVEADDAAVDTAAEAASAPVKMVCPQCGTPAEDGSIFCMNCGHRLA